MNAEEIRKAILGANDRPVEVVETPEWAPITSVRVAVLSGKARDALMRRIISADGAVAQDSVSAAWCAACVVDDQGEQVFSTEDIAALGEKAMTALDRVAAAAVRLNKMAPEQLEELKGN